MKKQFLFAALLLSVTLYAQVPDFSITGFATLNGGTTGGSGGEEVFVSSYNDLKKYAETVDKKYIIYISDTIKGTGSIAGKDYRGNINVKSNKSLIGLGKVAFLDGIGLSVRGVSNVIVQNITFSMVSIGKAIPPGSEDIWATNGDGKQLYSKLGDEGRAQIFVNGGDLIAINSPSGGPVSSNVWIDHCEFYSENPRVQTNEDLYDGMIDVTQKSQYVTISWCYFHDHHKCSLIGSSDTDLYPERKVTFHHNYYRNISARTPFYRGSMGHFFNNYNFDVRNNVNTRMEACVKVEGNYFENCKNTATPNGSLLPGFAQLINNKEVNCTPTVGYPENCVADIPYDYAGVLTLVTDSVKPVVLKYAGVGKLDVKPTGLDDRGITEDRQILSEFPNPCRDYTTVSFFLLQSSQVELAIFDLTGKKVKLILDESFASGFHDRQISTRDIPSGAYVLSFTTSNAAINKRLVIENR